jgi:NADPH2:quinone reductase
MKAIRVGEFGGPGVLQLQDVPDLQPGKDQVVVRVQAAGVNPVETYVRTGTYAIKPNLPWTPGSDGAGEIIALGEGVSQWKVGARVYTSGSVSGTYAQQCLCEVADVHPLPENVSFAQGAAVGVPYATAHRALFGRARAQAGETVFVHGASGGVGLAAVQLARDAGLTVIGSAGSKRGRELVLQQGAHYVVDHHAEDYLQELLGINCGRGPDIILEMLANENLAKDLSVIAKRGRIVVIGNRGSIEINPRSLMAREADVLGMVLFNMTPEEKRATYAALDAGLESGVLRPVVDREFPLAAAPQAHEAVIQGDSHGKIVLTTGAGDG